MMKYLQSENAQLENEAAAIEKGYIDCPVKALAKMPLPTLLKISEDNLQYFARGDEAVEFEDLPQEIQDQL